jgi:hypothetical protein
MKKQILTDEEGNKYEANRVPNPETKTETLYFLKPLTPQPKTLKECYDEYVKKYKDENELPWVAILSLRYIDNFNEINLRDNQLAATAIIMLVADVLNEEQNWQPKEGEIGWYFRYIAGSVCGLAINSKGPYHSIPFKSNKLFDQAREIIGDEIINTFLGK